MEDDLTNLSNRPSQGLGPCPFCNSAEVSVSYSATMASPAPAQRFVECEQCCAMGPTISVAEFGDKEATRRAIAAWTARTKGVPADVRGALEAARHFLTSTNQESGWCCCGDTVAAHNIGSGHSPTDEQQYYAGMVVEKIDAALEALGQSSEGDAERLREALEQIRDTNGANYDSDRAWALALQLRASVALKSWLTASTKPEQEDGSNDA